MSENCNHNCSQCSSECTERGNLESFREPVNEMSSVKKVIGIVSGKGGVGKSLVTSMLAVAMRKKGYKTAVLDADITGPSIPKAFGAEKRASVSDIGIFPVETKSGIEIMSINLLLGNDSEPVVWRGPIIAGAVKQFWTDVVWGDIDYMFVDMPPGTGDVPLTVFQSLPVDGIVVVTSPQELVEMIVGKAVKMAEMMNIPIIGIVENMSFFKCPSCGEKHRIYGESRISEFAGRYNIKAVSEIPIEPEIAQLCDKGQIENVSFDCLDNMINELEKL